MKNMKVALKKVDKILIETAMNKALTQFDQYNWERYSRMLEQKTLTNAEKLELNCYLGNPKGFKIKLK